MDRRNFLKVAVVGSAAVATGPAVLSLAGCDSTTLKGYLNVVLNSAEKILAITSASDPWFETLSNAIAALQATEASWSGTTTTAAIVSALNALEAVLAVIPVTSQYSALIDLLVTAVETILTTFVKSSDVSPLKATTMHSLQMANPHRGRVTLKSPHILQTKVGAYKSQWNGLVADLGLAQTVKL